MEAQVLLEEHAQPYTENTHLKLDATRESINYICCCFFFVFKTLFIVFAKKRVRDL